MLILLTNDDGFDSPYLHILAEAACKRGHRVIVSAPMNQQSGKSQAFTMTPLEGEERAMAGAEHAWAIDGTPADCCRIGFKVLCGQKPDLVISGMNKGFNIGTATFVSGTVGAAREAAFQDIPALATSVCWDTDEETARWFADYCVRTGEKFVQSDVPEKCVCNINCPPGSRAGITGARMASLNHGMYTDGYRLSEGEAGRTVFTVCGYEDATQIDPDSDYDLILKGIVSVTFLTMDGCDQAKFADFPIWP